MLSSLVSRCSVVTNDLAGMRGPAVVDAQTKGPESIPFSSRSLCTHKHDFSETPTPKFQQLNLSTSLKQFFGADGKICLGRRNNRSTSRSRLLLPPLHDPNQQQRRPEQIITIDDDDDENRENSEDKSGYQNRHPNSTYLCCC